jgi:hypothetical protein
VLIKSAGRLRTVALRRAAAEYAAAGLPVGPGAWWDGRRFRCGTACPVDGLHPAGHGAPGVTVARSRDEVARWPALPYTLLLVTGLTVEAFEVPMTATAGPDIARALCLAGPPPVVQLPAGSWLVLVTAGGDLDPEILAAAQAAGLRHHGPGSHAPLPPSRLYRRARATWVVPPGEGAVAPADRVLRLVAPLLTRPSRTLATAT